MEYVLIHGERVPIPPEIVSEGRAAIAAHVQTLRAARTSTPAPPAQEE